MLSFDNLSWSPVIEAVKCRFMGPAPSSKNRTHRCAFDNRSGSCHTSRGVRSEIRVSKPASLNMDLIQRLTVLLDTGLCGLTSAINNLETPDAGLNFSVRSKNSLNALTGQIFVSGLLSISKDFSGPRRWVFLNRSKENCTPFCVNIMD